MKYKAYDIGGRFLALHYLKPLADPARARWQIWDVANKIFGQQPWDIQSDSKGDFWVFGRTELTKGGLLGKITVTDESKLTITNYFDPWLPFL